MEQKMLRFLENSKSIGQFKQTHLQIIINGLQDYTFLVPKLISISSNLISLDYAVKIFRNSQLPNVVAYNTMIKCFIGKTHKDALHTYNHMRLSSISPNSFTLTFLLRCFESFEYLQDGLGVHGHVVKLGFDSIGRWQDAMSFRKVMKNQGIEKVPGCSSIQIADGVHEFTAKDVRHVERKEIYRVLNILDGQFKQWTGAAMASSTKLIAKDTNDEMAGVQRVGKLEEHEARLFFKNMGGQRVIPKK
ncbi:hypothetical protein RJ639_037156 [Escallonia herrerae]|uniref:Pentatricopeptide repeat-containing protein n=1 Tax=Escallonia herrerae TaxID=1293975 RepID=A0AA89B793_9ASTE|nr:hypothetical protein RJ639_037156 [Escallonia herrerae]